MIVRAETLPTTAEEFLQWPDSEGREFVDGHPTERSSMGSRAGAIAGMVYFLLMLWNKGRGGCPLPGGDVGYQCFADDPERVRKPDVSFIRAGRLSGNTVPEGWIQIVPDLVVEVLSPTDVWAKTAEKIAEYRAAGIPLIWIVDPVLEQVHIHRSPLDRPEIRSGDDELRDDHVLPGFSCKVSDLFVGM
jgi:Uma2 family endonuclease